MADTPRPRTILWQRRLLAVSLILNFLIIGAVVGMFIAGPPGGPRTRFDFGVDPLARALDADHHNMLITELRDDHDEHRPRLRRMAAEFTQMITLLQAETFDANAFREVLDRQRMRITQMQSVATDRLIAMIEEMTLEERRAFAERFSEGLRPARHMDADHDDD